MNEHRRHQPPERVRVLIDLDETLKALEGDQELLRDCLMLLAEDLPDRIRELRSALDGGDLKKTSAVAHTIKGSVAVVGATDLKKTALEVEAAARSEDSGKARDCVDSLERQWNELQAFLRDQQLL